MPDVFELVHRDHEAVARLVATLRSASPKEPDELRATNRVAQQLVIDESRHEVAEERVFWPFVRLHVPDGQALADKAMDQEQKGKWVLHQLSFRTPENEGFVDLVEQFATASQEHIAFEETVVWPALRAHLKRRDANKLARKFVSAEASAPTRPHPAAPTSARGLRTVGSLAGVLDRSVDFITGRGRDRP